MHNSQSNFGPNSTQRGARLCLAAKGIAVIALCAPATWAEEGGGGTVSNVVVRIEADNGINSASWEGLFDESFFDSILGTYDWSLLAPIVLLDGLVPVATVNEIDLFYDVDPEVQLGFNVSAGAVATSFTITSALVSFGAIFEPEAAASAAITVTDVGNNGGASLTGGYAGGTESYIANYNGLAPGGTNYATLVDNIAPFAVGTKTTSEFMGFDILTGVSVSDISSQFKFTLSASDQASGTSTFLIRENPIPEPATMLFLAVGGWAVTRRMTRRQG